MPEPTVTTATDTPAPAGALPAELPEGCTRRMEIHLNFGSKGGSAVYSIYLPTGERLPIQYQYDTRKKDAAPTGFIIDGEKDSAGEIVVHSTWRETRAAWKAMRATPG